jgi:5-formyltetrahydrofolate cyclo-ligase
MTAATRAIKASLRRSMLQEREALPRADVVKLSQEIRLLVEASDLFRQAQSIGCYSSFRNEVETSPILESALNSGKIVSVPRTFGNRLMIHGEVTDIRSMLPNEMGILQPRESAPPVLSAELDLIIMPGIAFTRQGDRLGFGGGFYDTYLQDRSLPVMGLAYDFQMIPEIPREPHDCRVDCIVTKSGIIMSSGGCAKTEGG